MRAQTERGALQSAPFACSVAALPADAPARRLRTMPKAPTADEGFGKHIALDMSERGDGVSRCVVDVQPIHLNPHGVVHGAVIYAMADQGMGAAVYSKLEPDESCATIEIKIVYMASATSGRLECETRLLNKGRRVAVLESEVRSGERLIAKALGTFAIFPLRREGA